jgi:hypothetical protein
VSHPPVSRLASMAEDVVDALKRNAIIGYQRK